MLRIGRLRLVLPPGFAGDPRQVAHRVAEELARRPLPGTPGEQRIERLAPPAAAAGPRPREAAVAGAAAQAIHDAMQRGR